MAAKSGEPSTGIHDPNGDEVQPINVLPVNPSFLDMRSIQNDIEAFPGLRSTVLTILLTLLQSERGKEDRSIQNAMKEIIEIYPTTKPSYYAGNDVEIFFWELWGALFRIVHTIPYNDPKQELFINLLLKLRRRVTGTATVLGVCVPYFPPSHRTIRYTSHYIQSLL
jgi:hypothetical protein